MPSPFLVGTTPDVYARDSFGMEGFRAFDNVRAMPCFQAEAAMLMGVLGVGGVGVSCSEGTITSLASVAGKGSEFRKACLVDVTREERLEANREDFRGGRVVSEGEDSFGRFPEMYEVEVYEELAIDTVDEIERRRSAEG